MKMICGMGKFAYMYLMCTLQCLKVNGDILKYNL